MTRTYRRLCAVAPLIVLSARGQTFAQQPVPASLVSDVRDLPLIEQPSPVSTNRTFVVFLTGDGGWATLDRNVSRELTTRGVSVVAFNTRVYLSRRRSPDEAGSDMIRVVRHYLIKWSKDRVAFVGYSRGADIAPFIVSRLPAELKAKVSLVALLGFSNQTNFQFHFVDIFMDPKRKSDVKTLPELEHLSGMNILCVYGGDEKDSACRSARPGLMKLVERSGGHHFDDDFKAIGDIVFDALPKT
jgi:type IV secretory pathway VirJ component